MHVLIPMAVQLSYNQSQDMVDELHQNINYGCTNRAMSKTRHWFSQFLWEKEVPMFLLEKAKTFSLDFLDSHSDLYSALVSAVMYAISCYIGPRYNSTQMYIDPIYSSPEINLDFNLDFKAPLR